MLKDLFFTIWYDEFGSGWVLLTTILFLLSLAVLLFIVGRIKAQNAKFDKKHLMLLLLVVFFFYQIIPVFVDLCATSTSKNDLQKAIQIEKKAIKMSLLSWQKGCYYCNLFHLYLANKDYKKMDEAQKKAYEYLKSYKAPSWGMSFLSFYTKGDYDEAIEITQSYMARKDVNIYQFISNCYLMKNDIKNAELYIDKSIREKELYSNLAIKSYILKVTGNMANSNTYYQKAMRLCKNNKEKEFVRKAYSNFPMYESKRLEEIRRQQDIK